MRILSCCSINLIDENTLQIFHHDSVLFVHVHDSSIGSEVSVRIVPLYNALDHDVLNRAFMLCIPHCLSVHKQMHYRRLTLPSPAHDVSDAFKPPGQLCFPS
jgi:hypothetical protein